MHSNQLAKGKSPLPSKQGALSGGSTVTSTSIHFAALKTEKNPCYNLSESLLNLVTPIVTSTVIYIENRKQDSVMYCTSPSRCSFTNDTLCCGIITEYYHLNTMLQSGVVFPVFLFPLLVVFCLPCLAAGLGRIINTTSNICSPDSPAPGPPDFQSYTFIRDDSPESFSRQLAII